MRKSFIWGNLIFLGHFLLFDWAWLELSQATVTIGSLNSQDLISFMITTGSWNSQDMIRILKQSRHDVSGEHLCDECCMDIMWCLCAKVKIQQRVIWLCITSLRICYLKLVSAIFHQIFIFHQMIALQKLWKMFFISSKKLFLFLRYLNFCIFIFPSFFPCKPLL